jgi:putative salt-induced outer membrane protein YdiY
MAGYYFVKRTNTFLSGEVGPSFVFQQLGEVTDSYVGLRVGERFEHKFDGGAKIWETLEWIPEVDQFENWILNAEAGVSAPITKSLDVRLVAQDSYNNRPATGRLKNDLKLLAGVGYRF